MMYESAAVSAVNGGYGATSRMTAPGRLGEVANGCFVALQFEEHEFG